MLSADLRLRAGRSAPTMINHLCRLPGGHLEAGQSASASASDRSLKKPIPFDLAHTGVSSCREGATGRNSESRGGPVLARQRRSAL